MSEDVYVIERIVDCGAIGSHPHYLVKWYGYDDPSDYTWEPIENFEGSMKIIEEFHRNRSRNTVSAPKIVKMEEREYPPEYELKFGKTYLKQSTISEPFFGASFEEYSAELPEAPKQVEVVGMVRTANHLLVRLSGGFHVNYDTVARECPGILLSFLLEQQ